MSEIRQFTLAACILVTLPYRSATVWSAAKVGKAFGISKRFAYFCCALSLMEVYPTILRSEVWAFGKPKGERLEPLCKRNVNDKNNREKNGIRSTSHRERHSR